MLFYSLPRSLDPHIYTTRALSLMVVAIAPLVPVAAGLPDFRHPAPTARALAKNPQASYFPLLSLQTSCETQFPPLGRAALRRHRRATRVPAIPLASPGTTVPPQARDLSLNQEGEYVHLLNRRNRHHRPRLPRAPLCRPRPSLAGTPRLWPLEPE